MVEANHDGALSSRPVGAWPAPAQIAVWGVLVAACFWWSVRGWNSFQLGAQQDDAMYVVLAHSLVYGDTYGLVNGPGPARPQKYGFGFPLLLAPVVWALPDSPAATAIVPLAATLANLSLLFWGWPLLSPRTSRWCALAVAALYGFSPMVVRHSRIVMTEPVFTALVLTGLMLSESCVRRPSRRTGFILGAVVALACFTRPIGLALAAAAVIRLGLARRAGDLAAALVAAITLVGLVVATTPVELAHLFPREYVHELRAGQPFDLTPGEELDPVERLVRVAGGYLLREVRRVVVPIGGGARERNLADRVGLGPAPAVLGALVSAIVTLGTWRLLRSGGLSATAMIFQLLYFVALLFWPWYDARFLYPVLPLISLEALAGVAAIASRIAPARWRGEAGRTAAATVWALLFGLSLWRSLPLQDSREATRDLSVGTTWLAANSPPGAIVAARYPEAVYLYSRRQTVDLPTAATADEFDRMAAQQRIDFVLIAPELYWRPDGALELGASDRVLLAALEDLESRRRVELVYASDPRQEVRVYRVL